MRRTTQIMLAIIGLTLSSIGINAQTSSTAAAGPRLVSYSGKATNTPDKTMSGIAGITFALYRDQTGGAPLWAETQSVTTDAKGNYTVQLGSTKAEGLPIDLFNSTESRWLGVQVSGQDEQPRVLLLSVPYAMKAADSETLGGLPASAFMLAGPVGAGPAPVVPSGAASPSPSAPPAAAITGSGTTNFLPLWTSATSQGSSIVFQAGTGSSAKIGINTTTPVSPLDVKGAATVRGTITLPASATATASGGKSSQGQNFIASAYNSSTSQGVNQTFRWQAEAANNNTSSANGTLNLLFGQGSASPAETGLKIAGNGQITFAPGQTFPGGGGTVTSVGLSAPSSDFTVSASPITTNGTIALDWNVAPTNLGTANSIVKRDANGNFVTTGIGLTTLVASRVQSSNSGTATNTVAVVGGATSVTPNITYGVSGFSGGGGGAGVLGNNNNPSSGYGVLGQVNNPSYAVAGTNANPTAGAGVYGSGAWGFATDSNVRQGLGGGGWVKAMLYLDNLEHFTIARCYNSTLAGAAANTPPCGFSYTEREEGVWDVNFGFRVDDRFFSLTADGAGLAGAQPYVCLDNDASCDDITPNEATVYIQDNNGSFINGKMFIIVF